MTAEGEKGKQASEDGREDEAAAADEVLEELDGTDRKEEPEGSPSLRISDKIHALVCAAGPRRTPEQQQQYERYEAQYSESPEISTPSRIGRGSSGGRGRGRSGRSTPG